MEKIFIGIDGGATSTRIVIVSQKGKTLYKDKYKLCSNLSLDHDYASANIIKIIEDSIRNASLKIEDISCIGIGLAGASNKEGRDFLFGHLDQIELGPHSIIMSDTESAYKTVSINDTGLLASVGTGVNFIMKDIDGNIFTAAGAGHDNGDLGSGFWIGRSAISSLGQNESMIHIDKDYIEVFESIKKLFELDNLSDILLEISSDQRELVSKTASLAELIINNAESGNLFALSIIQEAAMHISDYIILVTELQGYNENEITIYGNGSLLRNMFFRKLVNQSLKFNFKNVRWIFSRISSAYGSALIAAKSKGIEIQAEDIIENGDFLGT